MESNLNNTNTTLSKEKMSNELPSPKILLNEIFLKNSNDKMTNLIQHTNQIPNLLEYILNCPEQQKVISIC